MDLEQLIIELFKIGCVKFGEFSLKSGIKSPVYFDLRLLVSYPSLLKSAGGVFSNKLREIGIEYDIICGVPYGAISLATSISIETNKCMIFKRKDVKAHGTSKMIEGNYKKGDRCLIVDDVITSGISIIETVEGLKENGIEITDAIVLLDREQGGKENVLKHGVKLHSIIKTSDVLDILLKSKHIDQEIYDKTVEFLNSNRNVQINKNNQETLTQQLDFESRGLLCKNQVGKKLFEIMSLKQSNLCFSADFNSFDQLLKAADELGPHICMLKTHIDILDDFNLDKVQQLVDLSLKHNFLIFEDRKFADIGNTVKSQFSKGLFKISQWANIVNAHSIVGPGVIDGLKDALDDVKNRACLLIAQLSSKGNLIDDNYIKNTIRLAEENSDFIIGFICQKKLSNNPTLIHMAPGIQFSDDSLSSNDKLGQQYTTPEMCILENKCDMIIVGRGIMNSENHKETAIKYQRAAFNAYLKRINCMN